uniref:Uncharacterized protein n=1 Tax=Anguilla anguilla TaxID=7936 RepID=A0A0E9TJA7_ANGAN
MGNRYRIHCAVEPHCRFGSV